ncbi:MAG: damage-inducible protein [Omnitrophica WOR_2 bacterium RIFCSPLOWO2_12_FULL_51_24]|nr:MAG: damage-inducible protein [Omnitrophica WOR_2 bacterium RIFCSPHIGHO2_01_FULL_49_10]OGX34217.1 MAG: damage-inducible protein [Omnitrophica WOR_2 bacterium RIFCSPLOWO2_02_FULL_50_19]OGX41526.1 MAG: damage-inducible protein [Omnitrophica WOR_2 bacterium RIFCSPLOWO2_12_FULL_51_24]
MYAPAYTKQFSKDVKLAQRRRKNMEKLKMVVSSLIAGERLDPIHRDHKLTGDYMGRRECHIESDWLLIYKIHGDTIVFERNGNHSDLFKK